VKFLKYPGWQVVQMYWPRQVKQNATVELQRSQVKLVVLNMYKLSTHDLHDILVVQIEQG
jgi:hypothetical protein